MRVRDHRQSLGAARTLPALLGLVMLALLVLASGCSSGTGRAAAGDVLDAVREAASSGASDDRGRPSSPSTVRVTRVVDGDTLEVSPGISGTEDVRLIGVDTPESAIPGEPPQPLGEEAAAFTARELEGEKVTLTFDEELVDPYDRILAYARLPGSRHTHNESLVRRGLGQVAIFEPNDALADRLYNAQDDAWRSGAGIWSLPARQQCLLADRGNGIGGGSVACKRRTGRRRRVSPTSTPPRRGAAPKGRTTPRRNP